MSLTQKKPSLKSEIFLKDDSIETIFQFDYTSKKNFDVDLILQIIHIKKNETGNLNSPNEIYTASLSDKKYHYNRFVICREPAARPLEEGEYVKINVICPMKLETQPERVILIKDYTLLGIKGLICTTIPMKEALSGRSSVTDKERERKDEIEQRHRTSTNTFEQKQHSNNKYIPLSQLTTFSKEFCIYVRVISKSEIKKFNGKRTGSLFDFIVIDEEKTKMQIVAFDKTVDKFYPLITENKVYEISGGYIKINDRKFKDLNSDYKIIIGEHSIITEKEDDNKITLQTMEITSIKDIMNISVNSVINVLCIVVDEGQKIMKTTRNGQQEMRQTIIMDKTGSKIELTLWRQYANINIQKENVLLLKKVKVGDFNGRNLSSFNETSIIVGPKEVSLQNEISELTAYYQAHHQEFIPEISRSSTENKPVGEHYYKDSNNNSSNVKEDLFSSLKSIGKIDFLQTIIESMSNDEGSRYPFYKIKATVTHLSHNDKNFYPGCPDKECARKLTFDVNKWICLKCNRTYEKPKYYYSLNIRVKDCSCEYWIDIFGKTAESFLKMNAGEYRALLIDRDDSKLKEISNRIENKNFYFLVKPKVQKFNNIPKKKFSVNKIENVESQKEAYRILKYLKENLLK